MSVIEEPMLPNAIEAEEALLGSILLDPAALSDARQLQPDDFYRLDHQTIFARIRELEAEGTLVDYLTLAARLQRRGELAEVGGQSHLLELVNAVPTSTHAPYYADLVKKAADGRKVVEVASALAHVGYHSTNPAQAAARLVSEQLATPHAEGEPAERLTPEQASEKLKQLAPSWASLRDLLEQDYPPTLWVVPNLLPEGLTLLAAKPKLGKSWMALGLALAVASGGLALGQTRVEPGAVLYLALEDSPKRLKHRTSQLLGSAPVPDGLTLATESPRLDTGGLERIELWLQATPDARLVILDTLAKLRGQARSGVLYSDDYASLEAVQRLAHRYGVGILVIHHTGKESRDDALDEVNATQGLNGVADNILVLRRERTRREATLIGDGRELNGIELSLLFDTATGAWSITEPRPAPLASSPEREAIVRLLIQFGPLTPKEIAKKLGKNESTIRNTLSKMAKAGEVRYVGWGKYAAPEYAVDSVDSIDNEDALGQEDDTSTFFPHLLPNNSSQETTLSMLSTLSMGVQETAPPEAAVFVAPSSQAANHPPEPTVLSATIRRLGDGATSDAASSVAPSSQAAGRPQEPLAPGLLPNPGQQPSPHLQTTNLSVLETLLLQPERYFTQEAVVRCAARLLWRGDPANRDEAQPFLEKWLARFGLVPTAQWEDWLDMEHQALYYEQAITHEAARRERPWGA